MTWHIVQTIGMKEDSVGRLLNRSLGLHWYVPLEHLKIVRRSRVLDCTRPLIPTYVFVHGIEDGVHRDVKAIEAVHSILDNCLSQSEIVRIRQLEIDHNRALDDWRAARSRGPRIGDRVRAKDGPFGSIESLLLAVRGKTATIEVPMLGSTRTATVKLSDLEKVA